MEIELTPEQAVVLADLIREHPTVPLTLRELRNRSHVLAEFGTETALIKPATPEGGTAA